MNSFLFWILLAFLFYFAYMMGVRRGTGGGGGGCSGGDDNEKDEAAAPPEEIARLQAKLEPLLAVSGHKSDGGVVQFEGKLQDPSEKAFDQIREAFAADQVSPIFLEGDGSTVRVVLLPANAMPATADKPKWWLHWLLFAVTIATTTWAGALHAGVNLLQHPEQFAVGLPYSLGLMLILGAHELGHYFTARHHGIHVTPPFFIPVPFSLGTFGAFIRIKSLTPNRRALFDVAVAGPLAGLAFAIPALLIGISQSRIIVGNPAAASVQGGMQVLHGGMQIGSSFMMAILSKLALGASTEQGHLLQLSPLAFAGWLGLLVTALNLLPIGQLDGGHIAHALFGSRRGHTISVVALVSLFALALFVWPGLMMWAIIVFFIAGTRDAPPSNDVSPVGGMRKALGYFAFFLLVLILLPVPHTLYQTFGIHCPYA